MPSSTGEVYVKALQPSEASLKRGLLTATPTGFQRRHCCAPLWSGLWLNTAKWFRHIRRKFLEQQRVTQIFFPGGNCEQTQTASQTGTEKHTKGTKHHTLRPPFARHEPAVEDRGRSRTPDVEPEPAVSSGRSHHVPGSQRHRQRPRTPQWMLWHRQRRRMPRR